MQAAPIAVDAAIFGGGAAGLWSLDRLTRAGRTAVLFEAGSLGSGQTIAAQGIIHGGLKYTLDGTAGESARAIAGMPALWRECLGDVRDPHLSRTRVRAEWCALWRTSDLRSQLGMAGARAALQVRPVQLAPDDRPAALADSPGDVYRLDEPVIDPASLLDDLARQHADRILKYDFPAGVAFTSGAGIVDMIAFSHPDGRGDLTVRPGVVILTAGAGNDSLRSLAGLPPAMQLRPLHMVLVRGDLPTLNGHCTDGAKTRVTITTAIDRTGRNVWQVGGQVAEDGVVMDAATLIAHARRELVAVIPGFATSGLEWLTHRVDRAELAVSGGRRPADVHCEREGNVITAWPTKLALVPRLADRVVALVPPPTHAAQWDAGVARDWPHPDTAVPVWEQDLVWTRDH